MATIADLVRVEQELWEARMRGDTTDTLNGIDFATGDGTSLQTGKGWCSAAQHVCAEMAGLPTGVFGCCAHQTMLNMQAAGQSVMGQLYPGVFLFFGPVDAICHTCGNDEGHIVCLGGQNPDGSWFVYENTSSGSRGEPLDPGFKKTNRVDIDGDGTDDSKHLDTCSLTA